MIILGIETSCDETALSIIETRGEEIRIIKSLIHSQADLHSKYGGVFPTLAKREHSKILTPLLAETLKDIPIKNTLSDKEIKEKLANFANKIKDKNPDLAVSLESADFLKNIPEINSIAVTEGPGLEPTLWVGITFAKILSDLWNIPVIPINHMEGHIVGSLLASDKADGNWQKLKELPLPAISLLISGGHTELVLVEKATSDTMGAFKYNILGQTKDDAVGEAFDKSARLLGLPYPGGPHVSHLADEARKDGLTSTVTLPRPMIKSGDLDFSFAGLKTAVLYAVRKAEKSATLDENFKKTLCLEFEEAVRETLDSKLRDAIDQNAPQSLIIGGGVSANHTLREAFEKISSKYNIPLFMPTKHISGDNALMIALAGSMHKSPRYRELVAHGTKKLGSN